MLLTKVRVAVPPLTAAAQTEESVPPFEPVQVHVHGPVPVTDVAEPAEQRLLVGAAPKLFSLAEPQIPLTAGPVIVAVQVALEIPPFEPPHVQVEGVPVLGKAGPAGVVIPLPRPHIVPEKTVTLLE